MNLTTTIASSVLANHAEEIILITICVTQWTWQIHN